MTAITKSESEGVLILNDKGQIILINQNATELFSYNENELINAPINQIIDDGLSLLHLHALPAPENKLSVGIANELCGIKKNGSQFKVTVNTSQFSGGTELFTVAFISEHDLTQLGLAGQNLTPVIFLILDNDFNISVVNNYGCTFLGSGKDKLHGLNWYENFLPLDYTQQIQSIFNTAVISGKIQNYEMPVLTLRGEQYTIRWTTRVIYDLKGSVVATLSTGVDSGKKIDVEFDMHFQNRIKKLNALVEMRIAKQTTDLIDSINSIKNVNHDLQLQIQKRIAVEQKLIKIQRLYDRMVHHFPEGVIGVIDRQMNYLLLDGKEIDDIDLPAIGLTRKGSKISNPEINTEILSKVLKAFDGESVSFEATTADRVYNISVEPLPDSQNNINEILCVLKNITERKNLEQDLREALEKEKELSELKSRFVTLASHEFKTPLATILSSSFLLEKYNGSDFEREKLIHTTRIKRSVHNLTIILNEFLGLEQLEEKRIKVIPSEINIPNFFSELVLEIDPHRKKGQIVDLQHIGDRKLCFLDPHILWSILTNLISNALKYSKEGDEVKVTSQIEDNKLIITVADSGIGIPADEQKGVFGLFFRGSNTNNFKGTGLGLHIAEKNVKLLDGSISFKSEQYVGTVFTVILPSEIDMTDDLDEIKKYIL